MDDLALVPDDKNDNYNKHVKLCLGRMHGDADLVYVDSPMYDKKLCSRTIVSVPIVRPSEALSEFFIGHDGAVDEGDLRTPLASAPPPLPLEQWPPAQREQIVCKAALDAGVHPSRLRRLGIFLDGAGCTKQETFEGLFIQALDTGKRFLIAIFRKAELCDCGCRGFCTFWAIHDAILSDLASAASGKWGALNHLQLEFPEGTKRRARAGMSMGLVLAVCEIRADMPGYTSPMGFRASTHAINPCVVCNIEKSDLQSLDNVTLSGGPSDHFTTGQYNALVAT
jgi:hypothetical protein